MVLRGSFFFFLSEHFSLHDPRDNSGNGIIKGMEQMLYITRKSLLLVLNFRTLVLAVLGTEIILSFFFNNT